jgi:hypothetical protein
MISLSRFYRFKGGAIYSVAQGKDPRLEYAGGEMLVQDCKIDDGALVGIYTAGEYGK